MNLGGPELAIIVVVLLLLFGPERIPKMARSLGKARKEFETGLARPDDPDDPVDATPSPSPTAEEVGRPPAG